MTRILCFPLLFALAFPVFAQDVPVPAVEPAPTLGQTLPSDPVFLMQTRERLALDLQQVQAVLSVINPNDTQLVETLKAQQAELARQLRDVTQQMQSGFSTLGTSPGIGERSPGQFPIDPLTGRTTLPPMQFMPTQGGLMLPAVPQSVLPGQPMSPTPLPVAPGPFHQQPQPLPTFYPGSTPLGVPDWNNPGATPWGVKISEELTEVKQSVESLKKEIADLKELVKALEGQIRLLNENILLRSERARESGN